MGDYKRTARNQRTCLCCKETIRKGDKYIYSDSIKGSLYGICIPCYDEWELKGGRLGDISRYKPGYTDI